MQAVQSPQGWQDARGGPPPPPSPGHSSHAATSTRCSRRTSGTNATKRGARTCSWVATDSVRRPRSRQRSRLPSTTCCDDPGGRSRGIRRRRFAARRGPRAGPGRLGPRLGGTARGDRRALPGRRLREPVRDRRRSARRASTSRSRPSGPTTTTPTSAVRIGSSSAIRSKPTWRAATSRSTRWPGARARASRPR